MLPDGRGLGVVPHRPRGVVPHRPRGVVPHLRRVVRQRGVGFGPVLLSEIK